MVRAALAGAGKTQKELAEHMGWIQPQQRPAATQEATPAPAPAAQTAVAPASSLPVFTPSAGTDVKVETPVSYTHLTLPTILLV